MNAQGWLEKAKVIFRNAEINYRDATIETGRAVHEYILARLREGPQDKRPHVLNQRAKLGLTRQVFVREIIVALGLPLDKSGGRVVCKLIKVAMVAELLAENGQVGTLGVHTLSAFIRFVRRLGYGGNAKSGSPEDAERYELRPVFAAKATSLFRQAVAESWTQRQAWDRCNQVFKNDVGRGAASCRREQSYDSPQSNGYQPSPSSPGDAVEACLAILRACTDPQFAAAKLAGELEQIRHETRRRSLSEVLSA